MYISAPCKPVWNRCIYTSFQFYLGILIPAPSFFSCTVLPAGCSLSRSITTLGTGWLHWLAQPSSVVGGSERMITYCNEVHGGRGVYLNRIGKKYRIKIATYARLNMCICLRAFWNWSHERITTNFWKQNGHNYFIT
jgi:hypothetical protein